MPSMACLSGKVKEKENCERMNFSQVDQVSIVLSSLCLNVSFANLLPFSNSIQPHSIVFPSKPSKFICFSVIKHLCEKGWKNGKEYWNEFELETSKRLSSIGNQFFAFVGKDLSHCLTPKSPNINQFHAIHEQSFAHL